MKMRKITFGVLALLWAAYAPGVSADLLTDNYTIQAYGSDGTSAFSLTTSGAPVSRAFTNGSSETVSANNLGRFSGGVLDDALNIAETLGQTDLGGGVTRFDVEISIFSDDFDTFALTPLIDSSAEADFGTTFNELIVDIGVLHTGADPLSLLQPGFTDFTFLGANGALFGPTTTAAELVDVDFDTVDSTFPAFSGTFVFTSSTSLTTDAVGSGVNLGEAPAGVSLLISYTGVAVPEPNSMALSGLATFGLWFARRRRRAA